MLAWLGFAPGDGTQIVRWSCTVYGPGCVGTLPDLGTCDHVDHFCGESEPRGKHDSCAIHPIRARRSVRGTTENRAALWTFERLDTLRRTVIQRAGRLTRPAGRLTLMVSASRFVRNKLLHMLDALRPAA